MLRPHRNRCRPTAAQSAGLGARPGRRTRRTKRALQGGALIAALAAIVGGLQLAAPPPAAALPGLELKTASSFLSDQPRQLARAECDPDQLVVGGGGRVFDGGRKLVKLTDLDPLPFRYTAEAEAPNLSRDFNWRVFAYAVCADKDALDDYEIVHGSAFGPGPFQKTAAVCPSGTVAYGSGAEVRAPFDAQGHIGLQLTRTSGPLDISRATGREDAVGVPGNWTLESHAICAEPRGQIHVDGVISQGADATALCDDGLVHGPGGGGGLIDGGPVWLRAITPRSDLTGVTVNLTGPLAPAVGGMVAHFTCAN